MGEHYCTRRDIHQLAINLFGSPNGPDLWRVNGLMLVNAILMGVVVGIGSGSPQYRRHPVIGFLYLGATILFLPIVSLVATAVGKQNINSLLFNDTSITEGRCSPLHTIHAIIWAGIVLTIGINTSAMVAGDAREGRNIGPPTELLIKAIWIAYLALSTIMKAFTYYISIRRLVLILVQMFGIILIKLFFKYAVLYKARQSIAFGQSPRLIAGYMAQLHQPPSESQYATAPDQQLNEELAVPPPALVVMGEENVQVEKQPHGYNFKMINTNRLVTLDRVWRFDDMDVLLRRSSKAGPKDVCFSFALFKLLRCRFAKYTVSEAGFLKANKFFVHTLIQSDDGQRVFRVIADELSFIHDYYHSSLPISYARPLFPILSIVVSLYSIAYSLYLIIWLSRRVMSGSFYQIICVVKCRYTSTGDGASGTLGFGNIYYDAVPLYLVVAVFVLAEIRDIIFYICSNWTKVALIYHYINQESWQRSTTVQKCLGFLLEHCRFRLLNNWADKMNQCSILLYQPCWKVSLLFRLPNQKRANLPSAVKEAIFKALKCRMSEQEELLTEHIRAPSPPISGFSAPISDVVDGSDSPAHDGDHMAYTILVWHVATSVFEMGHPPLSDPSKVAATHLSRYCAYLVACSPDLLPDDDMWCKQLYKDVKKDADRILRAAPKAEYEQLVELLSSDLNHEVLKNGARLGKKLVDSNTEWEELARFWSELILYAAPSENLESHADAIARGGELITLLWTLLAHAGIVRRLDAAAPTTGDV
ncbi:unnamed protein product [Urochloa humidicola]